MTPADLIAAMRSYAADCTTRDHETGPDADTLLAWVAGVEKLREQRDEARRWARDAGDLIANGDYVDDEDVADWRRIEEHWALGEAAERGETVDLEISVPEE